MKYRYFDFSHFVPKGSFPSGSYKFLQNLPPVLPVFKYHICSSLFFLHFFSVFLLFFQSLVSPQWFLFAHLLSSFLSHPASPVAIPYWTFLYSQPFIISLQQQVHYPAVPNPNPNPNFGWFRWSSPGRLYQHCSQMWLRKPNWSTQVQNRNGYTWIRALVFEEGKRMELWSIVNIAVLQSRGWRQDSPDHQHTEQELQQHQWQLPPVNDMTVPMSAPWPKPKYYSEISNQAGCLAKIVIGYLQGIVALSVITLFTCLNTFLDLFANPQITVNHLI